MLSFLEAIEDCVYNDSWLRLYGLGCRGYLRMS